MPDLDKSQINALIELVNQRREALSRELEIAGPINDAKKANFEARIKQLIEIKQQLKSKNAASASESDKTFPTKEMIEKIYDHAVDILKAPAESITERVIVPSLAVGPEMAAAGDLPGSVDSLEEDDDTPDGSDDEDAATASDTVAKEPAASSISTASGSSEDEVTDADGDAFYDADDTSENEAFYDAKDTFEEADVEAEPETPAKTPVESPVESHVETAAIKNESLSDDTTAPLDSDGNYTYNPITFASENHVGAYSNWIKLNLPNVLARAQTLNDNELLHLKLNANYINNQTEYRKKRTIAMHTLDLLHDAQAAYGDPAFWSNEDRACVDEIQATIDSLNQAIKNSEHCLEKKIPYISDETMSHALPPEKNKQDFIQELFRNAFHHSDPYEISISSTLTAVDKTETPSGKNAVHFNKHYIAGLGTSLAVHHIEKDRVVSHLVRKPDAQPISLSRTRTNYFFGTSIPNALLIKEALIFAHNHKKTILAEEAKRLIALGKDPMKMDLANILTIRIASADSIDKDRYLALLLACGHAGLKCPATKTITDEQWKLFENNLKTAATYKELPKELLVGANAITMLDEIITTMGQKRENVNASKKNAPGPAAADAPVAPPDEPPTPRLGG